jgi:hypothetical protein
MLKYTLIIVVSIMGVALFANGVAMLYDPETSFWNVPGIARSGMYNQQFTRDVGIAYLFVGAGYFLGVRIEAHCAELWCASSLWLFAHALSHIFAMLSATCGPLELMVDFPITVLPVVVGLAASTWAVAERIRSRQETMEIAPTYFRL